MVWILLICLRIGSSGRLLWTRYWTFGFRKILGSSWVAAPREGLSSVSKPVNIHNHSEIQSSRDCSLIIGTLSEHTFTPVFLMSFRTILFFVFIMFSPCLGLFVSQSSGAHGFLPTINELLCRCYPKCVPRIFRVVERITMLNIFN
jgi:hypothetical protein